MAGSATTASHSRNREMGSLDVVNRSVWRASLIAGSALLLMTVLAAFGKFVVLEGLVTQGNAAQTATDIMNSETMFRFGIASLFTVATLDMIVAWALYTVFKPVNRNLSLLAGWFRIVYAGISVVATSQLVGVLPLLNNDGYLAVFSTEQLHAQALLEIITFNNIWHAGLILFGFQLLLLGYLAYSSGYMHKVLGILYIIAGVGYMIDSFGLVLFPDYSIEVAGSI